MSDHDAIADQPARDDMPVLLGGVLCLDFTNTVDSRGKAEPQQLLNTYADLVRWNRYVADLTEAKARDLLQTSAHEPVAAESAFAAAMTLREAIYRIFVAIARSATPASPDLNILEAEYARAMSHARLTPGTDGYHWTWIDGADLNRALWPVARSAVELLTSSDVKRVKECANVVGCGWLFLDRSKNGSRRWCSMDDCGSRDKMRRQYARRRSAQAGQN